MACLWVKAIFIILGSTSSGFTPIRTACCVPCSLASNGGKDIHAKSKKAAAQYESGTLAAFAVAGILLIALGVVSLLAVVGGLKGTLFSMVKRVMQGLGGGLCPGRERDADLGGGCWWHFPPAAVCPSGDFVLFTLLFFSVLGIIDLVSRVGQDTLPAYLVKYNNQAALPTTEASGYWNMICAAFNVCGSSGAFGGALGMVLGWPAWTFLGTVLGTVRWARSVRPVCCWFPVLT